MSDEGSYAFSDEFGNLSFKSDFARKAIDHFKQTKSVELKTTGISQSRQNEADNDFLRKTKNMFQSYSGSGAHVKLRMNSRSSIDDTRRFSCSSINNARRSCFCSNRINEGLVENRLNQSKVDILQWQLKETQKSRDMYRAVMKQVITFLEKAHHNLELLGNRMNRENLLCKSKSEHRMTLNSSIGFIDTSTPTKEINGTNENLLTHKDCSWKQTKCEQSSDEIPPDKLASEAFRLLRTAHSLLNTREPDLAHLPESKELQEIETDVEFLAQIAKEFPAKEYHLPDHRPQRTTSFSLAPKLSSETDVKMAFNRKLSLQLSEVRRCSKVYRIPDSARGSVAESDVELVNATNELSNQKVNSQKSNSPANESISSVEDESGFSSMNSFQEVGLPIVNAVLTEEETTRKALLQSMLHTTTDHSSLNISHSSDNTHLHNNTCHKNDGLQRRLDDVKLWQKPSTVSPQHKRWYSTPVQDMPEHNQNLKVLWV